MTSAIDGLAVRGRLIVVGVDPKPIQVSPLQLIGASRSIVGHAAGASIDAEDTLDFSTLSGVRPMIAGYAPTELNTEAAVTLEPEGQGFRISRSALILRAQVPNLDEAAFAQMASDAEKNCPISKVLNAAITLEAKLI